MAEVIAARLIMLSLGAAVAWAVMLMFGAWHAVAGYVPPFGYLQVLWPLLIAEAVYSYVVRVSTSE